MSSENTVISVSNVHKSFAIYDKPADRLKQMLFGRFGKRYYREFHALKDINFSVRKGECVGIIGRNGAGKSTLLQIITGTLQPSTGSIGLSGRVAALLELGSGFNPEFTGRENVYMNATVLGLSRSEIDAKYQQIVDFADIGDFINQPVKTYSSGMVVRLAFAVVAHVDADVLIVDEALAVGDAFFTQKCMRFIRKFKEEHTILFVSHDTGAITNLCTSAILLDRGKVVFQGTAKEVAERYLAQQIQANQATSTDHASNSSSAKTNDIEQETDDDEPFYRDMRQDFINTTTLRNDIELFQFNPDSSEFGTGLGKIINVILTDDKDKPLSWVIGGEMVKLKIYAECYKDFYRPILGFILKDRLGQGLFADNTCLTYMEKPLQCPEGGKLYAEFLFRMPTLYRGDYTFTISIAEGTQKEHVQHHWLNDAFILKSHAPSPIALMSVPMKNIKMEIL